MIGERAGAGRRPEPGEYRERFAEEQFREEPMVLPASQRIENVWMTLEQRGAPPTELLSADIYDSWMRCISFGLDTLRPPEPQHVSSAILRQEQQRCSLVRGLALAEMHT